jgi:hypothetical protein
MVELETEDLELRQQFALANELHINFYEGWLDEVQIRESVAYIHSFIDRLTQS